MQLQYVQYGCGLWAPETWRNFDTSPTLRLQKLPIIGGRIRNGKNAQFPKNVEYGNIINGLPVPKQSCKAVYCSHVLEHLALEEFRIALKNTYEYLLDGGIFRFVLPDLKWLAETYVNSDDPEASLTFMTASYLGHKTRPRGLKGFIREWMGNSAHLWMWDFESMSVELEKVGFRQIRRAEFGDSQDPKFNDVEEIRRWQNCLGIECVR